MQAILSNSTRKLIWFKSTKMLIAVLKIIFWCNLLLFSAHFRSLCGEASMQRSGVRLFVCSSVCLSVSYFAPAAAVGLLLCSRLAEDSDR